MNEQAFVDRRDTDWKRLAVLLDLAETSPAQLSAPELRELVKLYRRLSTDLATVRTRSQNDTLADFLNDLAVRAYGVLYRQPRRPIGAAILAAVALAAQTVRRRFVFVAISAIIFFGSGVGTFGLLQARPDLREAFVSEGMEPLMDSWKSGKFEERDSSASATMTGFYASNNPRVSIIAGSVGAGTFGFLSLVMIAQNGSLIGVLANELAPRHLLFHLLGSITPHGVPELSGIILSGSAGLLLGYALINPGRRSRAAALKDVGQDAIVILATSVVMMFIAAPIEGFFSFNPRIPIALKLVVGAVEVTAWFFFWRGYGQPQLQPNQEG